MKGGLTPNNNSLEYNLDLINDGIKCYKYLDVKSDDGKKEYTIWKISKIETYNNSKQKGGAPDDDIAQSGNEDLSGLLGKVRAFKTRKRNEKIAAARGSSSQDGRELSGGVEGEERGADMDSTPPSLGEVTDPSSSDDDDAAGSRSSSPNGTERSESTRTQPVMGDDDPAASRSSSPESTHNQLELDEVPEPDISDDDNAAASSSASLEEETQSISKEGKKVLISQIVPFIVAKNSKQKQKTTQINIEGRIVETKLKKDFNFSNVLERIKLDIAGNIKIIFNDNNTLKSIIIDNIDKLSERLIEIHKPTNAKKHLFISTEIIIIKENSTGKVFIIVKNMVRNKGYMRGIQEYKLSNVFSENVKSHDSDNKYTKESKLSIKGFNELFEFINKSPE